MHEVSHDQDQEKLQNRSESVVLQNSNNPIEQPFEEQLNEEIQHAGQHQHEAPSVNQQPIQSIAQPQQIQLIENQQSGQVIPEQVILSQQEIQEHQQERQEEIIVQENDQQAQQQIQQIEAVEVEQSQIQEINTIQNNQQNVENINQNENITIIEFDDSDEEKKEPDERQQYQESTVMKVTLSQYTNNQENQVHFSSMNISDFDTIKHNLQIETNNNKMSLTKNSIQPNSQQTLSNEQLEFQMQQIDEVNHEEKINTSISKYCSEPANTIKKPEMVHISPKNINQQQEVSVIQTFSNQSIGCDENQRNLSINNNSIFQQNAAYTVPASPNPKRIDFNSTNNFGNYKFSNSEPQNNIKLKINDNLYGVYSKSENKYNDNGKERRESNNLLNLQEWDIEDTQQSTNRSQHIQNLQATQDGCTLNKSNLIFNQTYQSQDTSKIQALDKYMSKYFDANIQEDQFSETIRESILFQESNRKLNQLNNPDSVQINIKRQQDEQVKYSKDNKENDITSFEDNLQQPPSIQRQGILQPIPNNANLSNQDELQMIKSIEVIAKPENTTVEQQYINNEGQLSSVRVNKDKELITFDESEDISEV